MEWEIEKCRTLGEYREFILRATQAEIALRAHKTQGWLSQIELGHLPKPKRWGPLLKAYQLDRLEDGERQFVRLIEGARLMREMLLPVSEKYPLFAISQAAEPCVVEAEFAARTGQQARNA